MNGDDAGRPSDDAPLTHTPPPWTRATLDDVTDFAFEAPITTSTAADAHDLGDAFHAAAKAAENDTPPNDRAFRVFAMLGGVTSMYHRPEDRDAPYGAMMQWEGRRTAIPEDFRGEPVAVLTYMAERAAHPALRARLSDVAWLLDRKRHQLAGFAVQAYVETIQRVRAGTLLFGHSEEAVLSRRSAGLLRRALQIARAQLWDGQEAAAVRVLVGELRGQSLAEKKLAPLYWFSDLDLDFAISDPAVVASDIESAMQSGDAEDGRDAHGDLDLWRLAARGYRFADHKDDQHRCQIAASDCQVAQAEQAGSAFLSSDLMSAAIAELHGIPGQAERRKALRHRLVDLQAGAPDELGHFEHKIDFTDIVAAAREHLQPLGLSDSLFAFADLARSPDPAELIKAATDAIEKYPLSSLFAASFLDEEGKVVHRTPGGGFGDAENDPAVAQQISQHERFRRQVVAQGSIETARRAIAAKFYISTDTLFPLMRNSPFVPNDLTMTFARGFAQFFQGDFVSAVYILVPLLENSLRHVLKLNGIDVTTFDDATQTQEDRTISSLFDQMRPDLDAIFTKAITTDIENVFLTKQGPALRHEVAHGLLHDVSPFAPDAIYACWLIFRLCMVPLFPHRDRFRSLVPS